MTLNEPTLPRKRKRVIATREDDPTLGARVRVCFDDGKWYGGKVTSGPSKRRKFEVSFDDGEKQVCYLALCFGA